MERPELLDRLLRHARAAQVEEAQLARAVRAALGLEREPRFELWFLRAGRVEVV